jgi:hypothetical protein
MRTFLFRVAVVGTCFILGRMAHVPLAEASISPVTEAADFTTEPTKTPAGDPLLSEEDCERAWNNWWRLEGRILDVRTAAMACSSIKCFRVYLEILTEMYEFRDGFKRIYEEGNCDAYHQ